MPNQSYAVLWDLDGTLIDSMEYHWEAWRDAMAAENFVLDYEQFRSTFGWRNAEILRRFFGPTISASEIERISLQKEERYRSLIRNRGIELLPGARHWLDHLKAEGWRQALATSAPLLNVDAIIEVLNLQNSFDAIVSAEQLKQGKPDPEIFLTAAARLNADPSRCIVVEDAPAGVEAGHRAGMKVIGVLSTHDSLAADLVVKRLTDLEDDAFRRLIGLTGAELR